MVFKKSYLWVFIIPLIVLSVLINFLVNEYPAAIAVLISYCVIVFMTIGFLFVFEAIKIDQYSQKNAFPLWKKSKMPSYKARNEASREIRNLASQSADLKKLKNSINKAAFILLSLWTLLFIGLFLFIAVM